MLKGIDPLLDAELLYVLGSMGHGDELALVDRNYPAASTARKLVRLTGSEVTKTASAILTLLPLDTYVDEPVVRMEVVGAAEEICPVHTEVLAVCEAAEGRPITMGSVTREEFYERARQAFAVVATSDDRPYACFFLRKGVIR